MQNAEFMENENELQDDEVTTESYTEVTPEDLQALNTNIYTGFLGVMAGLGVIAGCIVCSLFKDIFKKR